MFLSHLMKELTIQDLHVAIGDQEIVRGLSLTLPRGEVHAIMGPNGSGKSTLAKVLAGHPDYHVTKGKVLMDGENVLDWAPDERARKGLFLAFQYPSEIPGVTIANFLRAAVQARLPEGEELEATDYYAKLYEKMELLGMDRSFTSRSVNEGFSGGEKSVLRFCRWPCWNRNTQCSTKPTAGSTLTLLRPSRMALIQCADQTAVFF